MKSSERLDPTSIRSAIEVYLSLIDGQAKTDLIDLKRLAVALDRLVLEYNISEGLEPSDSEADPPADLSNDLYKRAGASFPELGPYPYADPTDDPGAESYVADAIDDLADIARDLLDVLWYFDQGRFEDGIWQFRFGYQYHWGMHLHRLRVLLHSTKICAW
jgi:Domain of unknown function (DUF5063)